MKKRKHSVHLTWRDYEKTITMFKHGNWTLRQIGVNTGLCNSSVYKIITEYFKKEKHPVNVTRSGLRDYMNDIRRREQMKFRHSQYKTILP